MKITLTVEDDRVRDLVITALEQGSRYWAVPMSGCIAELFSTPRRAMVIADVTNGNKDATRHTLGADALRRGLVVMAKDHPRHFGDWLGENDDAITADVFLQCCLFGEVLYG